MRSRTPLGDTLRTLLTGRADGMTDYVQRMRLPGDEGLHGPGSITWRVMSHPATLLGGVRALLLQSLDPRVVAGVARHSRFREDPIGRLQATARFVTVAAFASTGQISEECATVRAAHAHVHGTLDDGRPYAASDPQLLRFVHLCLVDSFLVAHRLCATDPLTEREEDLFVREQNRVAAPLGFDSVTLPRSRGELTVMLDEYAAGFALSADTVEALVFLADPPLDRTLRYGYRILHAAAASTLPAAARPFVEPSTPAFPAPLARRLTVTLMRLLPALLGPSPAYRAALARREPGR